MGQTKRAAEPQLIVEGLRQAGTDGDTPFRWRLVARNGRTVGQSSASYLDHASAADAFWTTVHQAPTLTGAVRHAGEAGWTWQLRTLNGENVARPGRTYERHDSAQRACGLLLDTLSALSVERRAS